MELYRKYFTSETVASLEQGQPSWGVQVLNAGHNLHPAHRHYPDAAHPDPYRFDWQQGRVLQEYQLVYIATGFESEYHFSRIFKKKMLLAPSRYRQQNRQTG